jgi:HlyD family secretion protein
MKRFLLLGIIGALVATVLIAGMTAPRTSLAEQTLVRKSTPVEAGTVTSSVKATGHLQPNRTVSLGFQVDGAVKEVNVVQGQTVVTDTLLAMLDTTDLETAVAQAQTALDKANAQLAKTKATTNGNDIASAKAALASAQAAYNTLIAGPNKDQVTAAAADLRTAEVNVQTAQGAYDKVSWKGGAGATTEAAALQTATIAYQKALASYNVAEQPPTDDKIKAAKASIASAQATLNNLVRGALPEDIALNQVDIESAKVSLDTAKKNLQHATLAAPFAGTVTTLAIEVGLRPAAATGVIGFADLSVLHVDVPVDEIDLPTVKLGQRATITLDALPNQPLDGKVTAIAPAPTTATDTATTYDVTVTLDRQFEGVATGMTAKVEIETVRHENVPVIPATLIQTDKSGGTFVEIAGPGGQPVHTPVTLGLRTGTNIEVTKGLQIGDQVLEPPAVKTTGQASGGQQQRGGMFPGMGGGGRPPGGGGPGGPGGPGGH